MQAQDEDIGIRMNAAVAILLIKDTPTVEPLILALKDEDNSVLWLAAITIKTISSHATKKNVGRDCDLCLGGP